MADQAVIALPPERRRGFIVLYPMGESGDTWAWGQTTAYGRGSGELEAVVEAIRSERPDIVIVSGDISQDETAAPRQSPSSFTRRDKTPTRRSREARSPCAAGLFCWCNFPPHPVFFR